ncbi:MAG: hypothetical protein F6K56_34275, partial [Moorea sp. SIO3G5]|nr:hypothetical protein [Moorena sp. SIO3G5]
TKQPWPFGHATRTTLAFRPRYANNQTTLAFRPRYANNQTTLAFRPRYANNLQLDNLQLDNLQLDNLQLDNLQPWPFGHATRTTRQPIDLSRN